MKGRLFYSFVLSTLLIVVVFMIAGSSAKKRGLVAVYQWWHPTKRNYFYGTGGDAASASAAGYVSKTLCFYAFKKQKAGTAPLYRYKNDRDVLLTLYQANGDELKMSLDRTIGYVYVYPNASTKKNTPAIYLFYTGTLTSYYLTSSKDAGNNAGYRLIYLAFYSVAKPPSTVSVSPTPTPTPSTPSTSNTGTFPTSFNALDQWKLRDHGVLDQGSCGACFAFTAATTVTYRAMIGGFSIQAKGIASPQTIIDCGQGLSYLSAPCLGGSFPLAMFMATNGGLGTCSPGNAGCRSGCVPYCSQTCPPNPQTCRNNCTSGTGLGPLVYASTPYRVLNTTVAGIKQEVITNGPVATRFDVYAAWMRFMSTTPTAVFDPEDLYALDGSDLQGGHNSVIVGWGSDSRGDYWILQNSWNTWWGDGGFFYVRAGYNIMAIEEYVYGAKYSPTKPTAAKRKRDIEEFTVPVVFTDGAPVALDPASPLSQSLGQLVATHFSSSLSSSSGFEFASVASVTSQLVSGINYQVTIAGSDGALVSGSLFQSSQFGSKLQVLSSKAVGKLPPSGGDISTVTAGDPSSLVTTSVSTGGLSGGAIAGAVVGSILGAVALLGVVAVIIQRVSRTTEEKASSVKISTTAQEAVQQPPTIEAVGDSRIQSFLEQNPNAVDVFGNKPLRTSITARSPPINEFHTTVVQ